MPTQDQQTTAVGECAPCDGFASPQVGQTSRFHQQAGTQLSSPCVKYHQVMPNLASITLQTVAEKTPKPKGHAKFSTIEVVHQGGSLAHRLMNAPWLDFEVPVRFYELQESDGDPVREYNAIFDIETRMMLAKTNRQSLVVFVGNPEKPELDAFAGFLGMLPFRGISVALISLSTQYPDPFR